MLHEPEAQERMRRIRMLLSTRFEYLPVVRNAALAALPGPAASKYVPCEACHETGRVAFGGNVFRCGDCDGTGRREAAPGDIGWDEYVELPVEEARAPRTISGGFDLGADIRRLDAELRKLRLDEWARAGIVADEEGWQARFVQMNRTGSYSELRKGLARLERVSPTLRWSLKVIYDAQVPIIAPLAERCEPLAVGWLALTMRGPIFVPPEYEQGLAHERRASVQQLLARGWKAGRIARELGVSAEKVKRLKKAEKGGCRSDA